MRKFKIINARAKSTIGQILEISSDVLKSADARNSGGDLTVHQAYNVVNHINGKTYGLFNMYQHEGDGAEWNVTFTMSSSSSRSKTWYVVVEVTEDVEHLQAPEPFGGLKLKVTKDDGRKAVGVATTNGNPSPFPRYDEFSEMFSVGYLLRNPEVSERDKWRVRDLNRIDRAVYLEKDTGNLLKEDTQGEPLPKAGKFYFIDGVRYLVSSQHFNNNTITFICRLWHKQ